MTVADAHFVNGNPLQGPFADSLQLAVFGLGCFWGAERRFWEIEGVFSTAAGYAGGSNAHPNYQGVCSGDTGHAEVVQLVFDPAVISFQDLLTVFWESHDPTQGMRQGNDRGTQYRSGIYTNSANHKKFADASKASYQQALSDAGRDKITTEVIDAPEFYFAEEYHQQYLAKNPDGYCNIGGTGVACPVNPGVSA